MTGSPNMKIVGRAAIAIVASFFLLGAQAQDLGEFRSGPWSGMRQLVNGVPDGCFMAVPVEEWVFIVSKDHSQELRLGILFPQPTLRVGEFIAGEVLIDRIPPIRVTGEAISTTLVRFETEQHQLLEEMFRAGSVLRLEYGNGGWIQIGLSGSSAATNRLSECAAATTEFHLSGFAVGTVVYGDLSVETLINMWFAENSACRGGRGDDNATIVACDTRTVIGVELERRNWCYGREGEYGAQMVWHRCGADSIRLTPAFAPPSPKALDECSGILSARAGDFYLSLPGEEGVCRVATNEQSLVTSVCSIGAFCRVTGYVDLCVGSGECVEIRGITAVRTK